MTDRALIRQAEMAMNNSYSPYSRFAVGAALECDGGIVFTGCNIENSALGCTICAERAAVASAVSQGHRRFRRLAVFSSGNNYCVPCGECRQVLSEFAPELEILCARADGRYVSYSLKELLPEPGSISQML